MSGFLKRVEIKSIKYLHLYPIGRVSVIEVYEILKIIKNSSSLEDFHLSCNNPRNRMD